MTDSQIITVHISKSDNIAKSRPKLKGKFLPIHHIYYHFTLQLGTFMIYFSLIHIEIEKTVAGLLGGGGGGGGGGAKSMLPPPLENYWGAWPPAPPPLPTPMKNKLRFKY